MKTLYGIICISLLLMPMDVSASVYRYIWVMRGQERHPLTIAGCWRWYDANGNWQIDSGEYAYLRWVNFDQCMEYNRG